MSYNENLLSQIHRDHSHTVNGVLVPCDTLTHCPSYCDCEIGGCDALKYDDSVLYAPVNMETVDSMLDDAPTAYCPTCWVSYDAKPVLPENANAICDACGRYRHDNADDDAPSAYLTDETLDEMAAGLDATYYASEKYEPAELRFDRIRTLTDARAYVTRNPLVAKHPGTYVGSYLSDGYPITSETAARLALILAATMNTHHLVAEQAEKVLA